jgi:hypothetical protein
LSIFSTCIELQAGTEAGDWLQRSILLLECHSLQKMRVVLWTGELDHPQMLLVARIEEGSMMEPLNFHRCDPML